MVKYSILLPTRQRHDTLKYAMETVLAQEFDDFELVVMDNCGSRETVEVVDSFGSDKIVYQRSDEVLAMSDNWERGLAACKGEYVTVIGDDDGLMPDALAVADRLIEKMEPRILSWTPHTYEWPDAVAPWMRNRLLVTLRRGYQAGPVASKPVLQRFYQGAIGVSDLPMIYLAFVHRSVIDAVKNELGRYFIGLAPDVFSGITNLWFTDQYILSERPLSMRGGSAHSTGNAHFYRSFGNDNRESYNEETGHDDEIIHPSLIPVANTEVYIASVKLRSKELLFPDDDRLTVDIDTVLKLMARSINVDPASYDETLRDIHALAQKHGIDASTVDIPEKSATAPQPAQGPIEDGNGAITQVLVNGDQAGISNIADAARLAHAMLLAVNF